MSDEHLILERADGFAVLTLNRPAKRNALTFAMRRALTAALATLAAADDVACVVLTGAAPDFCAGMDFTAFGGDAANRREIVESSTALFARRITARKHTHPAAAPITMASSAAKKPRRRSPGRVGTMVARPRATAATAR